MTKRIAIGDKEIGISGLDEIFEVGFRLGLASENTVRAALMDELKRRNYVPRNAEKDYEDGVWTAFAELKDRRMKGLPDREPRCRCGETEPGGMKDG